ncbi:hypothetical protein PPL_00823 [Heterostelium album PN500]|uniref:ADP-ribosylation factor n=1 Tax=Heterostelium pallidum (strain ATCC 26659 / Pp 5 / PN500) TaxID=670386 RepID=D3AXJ2_HETP5|nr:hypothetical protein PPL_00823 [Heterostelium album PN500]EFA86261.1 hypothetical protein PPL_00823 [Heterostelium album PN500]|eukprot:XP_020438366.1 hypothetical protein PPL_00823 [Heterostelium album PN500]
MGILLAKFSPEYIIRIIGLDNSGKTTILYRLKGDQSSISTVSTNGFNLETIQCMNKNLVIWDIGGHRNVRNLYRHYYPQSHALIFVVDASDHQRIDEMKDEFAEVLKCSEGVPTVLILNKQDKENAMTESFIKEQLKLDDIKDRKWFVQLTSALNSESNSSLLQWLSNNI